MKILIADDNPDSRIILKKGLEHYGHMVRAVTNGKEALRCAKESPPEIIISDILMPEMDGFRFCRSLKEDKQLRKIPFVFYTASYKDREDEKLAMSLGASRYIVKPVEIDEFLTIIKDVFREYGQGTLPRPEKPLLEESELLEMYEKSIVRKLDEKVRELELYKEIFINAHDAIAIVSPSGMYIKQNSAHRALYGHTDEELRGETPALYFGEEVFSHVLKKLAQNGLYRGELTGHTKSATAVNVELSVFPVDNEKGDVLYYVGIGRDITKRKESEREIAKQLENLKILNDIIRDVSSSLNLEDVLHKITKNACSLLNGDGASIGLYDEEKQRVTYPYHYNMPDHLRELVAVKGAGLAGQVIETKKPVILINYPEHPRALKEFVEAGLRVLIAVPLLSKGRAFGAIGVFGFTTEKEFLPHDMELLESVGQEAAIAIENASLYENLEQMFINTITSLASMLDAKSPWTKGHAERVTRYAAAVGREMGFDEKTLNILRLGGLLHDIGKIGTYDIILDKPGELTPEESELVYQHPSKGAEILGPIKQLKNIVPLVRHHHERMDGTGYPDGLKGEEIPLLVRILCVADAYDSMVADRPYRKSPQKEYAIAELKKNAGKQFDPDIVNTFLKVLH